MNTTETASGLTAFITQVQARASQAVLDRRLHPGQGYLLGNTLKRAAEATDFGSYTEPLGLLYLVLKAWGGGVDERAVRVSAACWLDSVADDLLEQVQEGLGEAGAGASAAVGVTGVGALQSIALGELLEGMRLETDPQRLALALALALDAFQHARMLASARRHEDLVGSAAQTTSSELIELPRGRCARLGLFLECGAVLSGCDEEVVASYRYVGEKLGSIIQMVEDLQELFGGGTGQQLADGKVTHPLAYFRRDASPEQQQALDEQLELLPDSVPEVVRLLCESGAPAKCEQALGILRERIHAVVATSGNQHPAQRSLLDIVDEASSAVAAPPSQAFSARLRQQEGDFHDALVWALSRFVERMSPWRVPWPPELQPWPMPHFAFDAARNIIRCPDVDGMPEEVLPFYVNVFGVSSADQASHWLKEHLSAVLAREMFRAWRIESGSATRDHWYEQFVASRLALGYVRQFQPEALLSLGRASSTTIARLSEAHGTQAEPVIAGFRHPTAEARFLDLGPYPTLLVQAHMMAMLLAEPSDLDLDMAHFLTPRSVSTLVSGQATAEAADQQKSGT